MAVVVMMITSVVAVIVIAVWLRRGNVYIVLDSFSMIVFAVIIVILAVAVVISTITTSVASVIRMAVIWTLTRCAICLRLMMMMMSVVTLTVVVCHDMTVRAFMTDSIAWIKRANVSGLSLE